jgi:pyruvate,water dikinase
MSNNPNKTSAVNKELAALARLSPPLSAELLARIRAQQPLAADEQRTSRALESFLARHGHRAFSLDLAQPTFRDDPTQLLAFLETAPPRTALAIVPPQPRAPLFLLPLVGLARRYARLREDQRYYWQKSLAVARSAFILLGRDLAARQLLAYPEDIFFATHSELSAYYGMTDEPGSFAARVAARKQEWEQWRELERTHGAAAYPPFLRGDTPFVEPLPLNGEQREWHGRGVSRGVARGVARIVQDPHQLGRVGAGEILVAPSTDPAWTPVFGRLKGLALERGGVLSHGAVVAREYGLPAVAAVPNLTHTLHDGEWIEVDGTEGIVRRISGE